MEQDRWEDNGNLPLQAPRFDPGQTREMLEEFGEAPLESNPSRYALVIYHSRLPGLTQAKPGREY